jgi:ESS family glutamate:Na+ symporter
MNFSQIIIDFSLIGVFLLVGTILRSKISFFQRYVIPASVIGGILGLILGHNVLGWIPTSDFFVQYAAALVNVLFAGLFIGRRIPGIGAIFKTAGAQYGFAVFNGIGQMAIGMLVVIACGAIGYTLHSTFGLLLVAGFQGGPGIPTAVSPMFAKLGWSATEAAAVGETCAITGLIVSVFIGAILVNMGITRKFMVRKFSGKGKRIESPTFVAKDNRKSICRQITSPETLSNLAYNFGFMALAIIGGKFMKLGVISAVPLLKYIPMFPFVVVAGMIVQVFLQKTDLDSYVDRETVGEISSLSLDILIVASLMAVNLKVVAAYGVPLTAMIIIGLIFNLWWVMWLAPRILPGAWFEKSLCEFGQATGATPQALLLLRMVDPELKSGAAGPFALKLFLFVPTINMLPIVIAPIVAAKGALFFFVIFCAAMLTVLAILRVFTWHKRPEARWFSSKA